MQVQDSPAVIRHAGQLLSVDEVDEDGFVGCDVLMSPDHLGGPFAGHVELSPAAFAASQIVHPSPAAVH